MEKFALVEERIDAILNDRERLQKENEMYRAFIKNVSDNYDCDESGHKYNTGCRCCEAKKILERKG